MFCNSIGMIYGDYKIQSLAGLFATKPSQIIFSARDSVAFIFI